MEPTPPDDFNLAELLKCGAVVIPGRRQGWEGSSLNGQQREYILDRDSVIRARKEIIGIEWQSIDCGNKSLAEQIRENALHALGVLLDRMRDNERKML